MRRFVCLLLVCAAWALAAAPAAAQDKVQLTVKGKAGQWMRYKAEGTLNMEAGGQKITLELKQVEKVTITEVAANGNITRESETESSETSINGQKLPDREEKTKTTQTVTPTGAIIAFKSSTAEQDEQKINVRLSAATNPIFSEKPVGVGDKWTSSVAADNNLGTHAGKAEYEVLAFEKAGGVDCVKIRMVYQEADGTPPLRTEGTYWIEKDTGDTVRAEIQVDNLPFGPPGAPAASGKLTQERTEGHPLGAAPAANGAKPAETKPEPKKEKTIDEVVKDYEKLEGVVTLYRKRESGRDTIYLELKEDQLDTWAMLQTTAATGTGEMSQVVAGDPISDLVFQFQRAGEERVQIVVPNMNFRADPKNPISRVVRRSVPDAYIESFKIEARQPERKSLLINVSNLFTGDISGITQRFTAGPGGPLGQLLGGRGGNYSLDREKTSVQKIKAFPENLVVESEYHFTRGAQRVEIGPSTLADPRSIPLKLVYNLWFPKDEGYRPRLADPRVGYFQTEYRDFTRPTEQEQDRRYILRWNLQKADPKARLSPPKKPIVFWLDNGIPLEYRAAVKEGILRWNKAFERVGIQNAIEVKQMPDDADWDHADMRYNVVRWVASPSSGYMIALFRNNPFTGEIVNASITADINFLRFTELERKMVVEPSSHWHELEGDPASLLSPHKCSYAEGKREQAWFGAMALRALLPAGGRFVEKTFINDMLADVVSHEMGHILGLRHNFVASTASTLDQLKDPNYVRKNGVSASVMDYNPFNISALKQKDTPFWMPGLGPYDYWAIQYGYETIDAPSVDAEKPRLKQIASWNTKPGLAYQPDESADSFDPSVVRFDLGSDPLAYYRRMLEVSRYLFVTLDKREPRKGESYTRFTQQFNSLINLQSGAAARASRYIGGLYARRNFRGDPNEKPTLVPVPAKKQREALSLLNTFVFAESAFTIPPRYFSKLAADPNVDLVQVVLSGGSLAQDFPVRDTISRIQTSALNRIMSPAVLRRISNNEYKVGDPARAFTLAELFQSVGNTLWTELGGKRNVGPLRRTLQRAHVDLLTSIVTNPASPVPDDAKVLAWDQLRTLKQRIGAARGGKYDTYTRVHLDETLVRINRALDARQTIGSAAPVQAQSLLQQLLGGQGRN